MSEREVEVLRLIVEGLTDVAIANRLCLAVGTVKVHASNIYGKLGVENRVGAVREAIRWGLVSLEADGG